MNDFNFRIGDKVYYPMATNEVLTIDENMEVKFDTPESTQSISIYEGGKYFPYHANPVIFPATEEMYRKLVHVYPNLEEPKSGSHRTNKEIIADMLASGSKYVICWVSDLNKKPNSDDQLGAIKEVKGCCPFVDEANVSWVYATPFDLHTGKNIVDFIDGKVILED